MKLVNTDLDFHEVTRLNKELCDSVVAKLESGNSKFKLDELTYFYFMAQHDYFTANQLKQAVKILSQLLVGKKL